MLERRSHLQQRLVDIARELGELEAGLSALQGQYETAARELQRLLSLRRRLDPYPLSMAMARSWADVCRAMDWPDSGRNAHRAVKRRDPALHALLHLCAFDARCVLEGVFYAQ